LSVCGLRKNFVGNCGEPGIGVGVVVGLVGIDGLMSPGSGFFGRGTGIGNYDSARVGAWVGTGIGVGVVKLGEVIL